LGGKDMLDKDILLELKKYIDENLRPVLFNICEAPKFFEDSICGNVQNLELETFIKSKRKPTFSQVLFSFIDKKGTSDSEVYKKAYIDRRHFSKIRSIPDYKPGKNAVIALALALELNKKETDKLLSAAGYSLSDSETLDLVIQFCIEKKIYDILEVNEALDYFSMKPLIGTEEAK
jgi:hypothetical protein